MWGDRKCEYSRGGSARGRLSVCEGVCMCVWVCVFVVFVINLSCSFRTLFFLFSAFFLQCFLVVGLFVFPAICFIGHLFVCCSYKCSGICLSLVSETQHKRASFPPSAHYFLFELAVGGTRSLGALFEVVWLLWSALHWLQLSSLLAEVEKTCASWQEMELSWGYLKVSCKANFTCSILRFISTTISEIKFENVI